MGKANRIKRIRVTHVHPGTGLTCIEYEYPTAKEWHYETLRKTYSPYLIKEEYPFKNWELRKFAILFYERLKRQPWAKWMKNLKKFIELVLCFFKKR